MKAIPLMRRYARFGQERDLSFRSLPSNVADLVRVMRPRSEAVRVNVREGYPFGVFAVGSGMAGSRMCDGYSALL